MIKHVTERVYWLLLPILGIVLLDEWLKYQSLQRLPSDGSLVDPGIIAFALHKNYGVAFNIPFALEFVLVVTVLICLGLLYTARTYWQKNPLMSFAALTVVIGALGNFYDRAVYDFTVDYIILFGTSAINLSDLVIISGALLLMIASKEPKQLPANVDTPDQA